MTTRGAALGGDGPSWRQVSSTVLVPTAVAYAAQGAVLPGLVVSAQQLGASPATAATVAALLGIGQLAGSVPAGVLAARFGDRPVLVAASLVISGCWSIASTVSTVLVLGVVVLIAGVGSATFNVARQSHVVDVVPLAFRARPMSTLGGVGRVGLVVGPLLGAAAQVPLGVRGAYLVGALGAALAGLAAWLGNGVTCAAAPAGRPPCRPGGGAPSWSSPARTPDSWPPWASEPQ